MELSETEVRLIGPPEADGEYVALGDGSGGEEIVHLHDYARIYNVPGLYEHIVQDMLGCTSPQVVVDGFADALAQLGLDPAELVLLDLGAGTGLVGELVSALGVRDVVGFDALAAARTACLRDRPGVYRDYLVGDLAAPNSDLLDRLRRHRPTGLISAGAFGGTHAPPAALQNAISLLPTRAPVVFTIDERWTQTDEVGGFRGALAEWFGSDRLTPLSRSRFQHRVSTTGSPIHYELVVAANGQR
jgi:hypothetical protein